MDRRRAVNESNSVPSNAKRWLSWVSARSRRAKILFVLGGIALVEAAWAVSTYWNGFEGKPELLAYRLCVGLAQKPCPSDATFVRNEGEDTVARWAQKECTGYKTRRIIISDGPTKECDCYVADVKCSSE
jgi:hypothetical protein